MKRRRLLAPVLAAALWPGLVASAGKSAVAPGNRIRVGRNERITSLAEAARVAQAGDTVEVEAGNYVDDVAVWERDLVRIVGVGGRPRITARNAAAEGKGIFVVRARGVEIENLEFEGARAPDYYGSGVRLERGSLRISKSKFVDNEFAILTANEPTIVLDVQHCEFSGLASGGNRGRALSHTIYAGIIDSLRVEGSYLHRGATGHLIKSRARSNLIRYNRITDEEGTSSYEIEFPDGGVAVVVGNLVQQGMRTENRVIVSYGAESSRWPARRLAVFFNTLVNDSGRAAVFVGAQTGVSASVRYNVLVGAGEVNVPTGSSVADNVFARPGDFVDATLFDYRPRFSSSWVGTATGADRVVDADVLPTMEYRHTATTVALQRRSGLVPLTPGAFQSVGS